MNRATTFGYSTSDTEIGRYILRSLFSPQITILLCFLFLFGEVEDIVIVTILVILAMKMVPKEVIEDCRIKAKDRKSVV